MVFARTCHLPPATDFQVFKLEFIGRLSRMGLSLVIWGPIMVPLTMQANKSARTARLV
jgi:hypothetical protein